MVISLGFQSIEIYDAEDIARGWLVECLEKKEYEKIETDGERSKIKSWIFSSVKCEAFNTFNKKKRYVKPKDIIQRDAEKEEVQPSLEDNMLHQEH
jgi:DNA-directed RNA polymerase specialized sigma24 family protein